METADLILPKFPFVEPSLDFSNIEAKRGIAMAAKIPMIATTIISSIKVNPLAFKRRIIPTLIKLMSSTDPNSIKIITVCFCRCLSNLHEKGPDQVLIEGNFKNYSNVPRQNNKPEKGPEKR